MISYEIFRDIQNQPRFWGFEGIFLWTFFILTIVILITVAFVASWTAKVIIILAGIISALILKFYSHELGVRGIKKAFGRFNQPKLIISLGPRFYDANYDIHTIKKVVIVSKTKRKEMEVERAILEVSQPREDTN